MKLLSYSVRETPGIGVLLGDWVLDLNKAFADHLGDAYEDLPGPFDLDMLSFLDLGAEGLAEARRALDEAGNRMESGEASGMEGMLYPLKEVKLMAPIPYPRKNIVCLGLNYADHVREGRKTLQQERPLPKHPIYFTKSPTTVTGPYDDIIYPRATERLDYEVELALVIGKRGKYIPEDEVLDHIMGYTAFNDISARDLQSQHGQWYKGKSCDTFAPMGPYLVTSDEVGDPQSLDLWLKVNGETRQSSNTANMIFDLKKIVSILSEGITLEVGDIIATGTPSGVGSAHPLGLLKVGDFVEIWIDKIGTIGNKVVAES
ncbi:MAG TPA: fumarylacetoacetate hydrolase family protein [Patescibacteria group bacterium]|nr:fumarylacetoacetate hydrolase family protein [Patescibacteria group bacterium]